MYEGTRLAIRAIDCMTPKVYVTNMAYPKEQRQETLVRFIRKEYAATAKKIGFVCCEPHL